MQMGHANPMGPQQQWALLHQRTYREFRWALIGKAALRFRAPQTRTTHGMHHFEDVNDVCFGAAGSDASVAMKLKSRPHERHSWQRRTARNCSI
jgi:hypothetical protein